MVSNRGARGPRAVGSWISPVCEYPEEGTVYVEGLDKILHTEEVGGMREAMEAWYKAGR